MIAYVRRFFAYPQLSGDEATARARIFHRVVCGVMVLAIVMLSLLVALQPETAGRRLVSMGLAIGLVLPLMELNRRGHTRLASLVLMLGLVALVSSRTVTPLGLAPAGGYFMVFFVALGGLLFSARGVIIWAILLSLLGMVLILLAGNGMLPSAELAYTPLTTWLYVVLCMGLSVLVHREVSGTMRDSLQRAQEEIAARRKAQERLRFALEAGELGVWVLDMRDRRFHVDPSLFKLYGVPAPDDRTIGYDEWLERVHPEDRARVHAAAQEMIAGTEAVRVQFRVVRADGSFRHVEASGVREADPGRDAPLVVGLNRDITVLRQGEQERERLVRDLGERVKELRLLQHAARILRPDRPFDRELVEQLVTAIPLAWQYPECCEARLTYGFITVATPGWRKTDWMLSTEFTTSDGAGCIEVAYLEPRPAEVEGPFLAEERTLMESLTEILVSYLDLRQYREELESLVETRTRQMREARDEAERASRAKGDFLATMSHEIRTPMNAILGYSQLLRRDPSLGKAQHERLDAILSSGDHLLTLINNVLDMSKIEAGKTALALAPADLHALLDELRRMFAALVAAKSLVLEFQGVIRLPRVVTIDAGRVRQVVINLLSNALKFTRRGNIVVRASCEPGPAGYKVTIAVTDSGPGIAPGQMSRVFEVFEQSDIGVQAGGAGLGLPISRELARLMGGDLTVSSQEGGGSTFTFTFDAALAEASVLAQARRVVGIKAGPRPRLLIVDDQPDNLTIADELLRSVGFETRLAMNGEEGLRVFAEWRPDAILIDARMPGIGGIEVIRRLRADGVAIPIVLFTASGLDMLAAEARAAGANDVVFKPYKEADMLAAFGRLLNLEYIHEEVVAGDPEEAGGQTTVMPSLLALFADVPVELLDQVLVATVQARTRQIEHLAEQVGQHSAAAAERIRKLVREFRHDELIAGLRAAIASG